MEIIGILSGEFMYKKLIITLMMISSLATMAAERGCCGIECGPSAKMKCHFISGCALSCASSTCMLKALYAESTSACAYYMAVGVINNFGAQKAFKCGLLELNRLNHLYRPNNEHMA